MKGILLKLIIIIPLLSLFGCSNQKSVADLNEEIKDLENRVSELEIRLNEKEQRINELNNQFEKYKQNLHIKERQFSLLEDAILHNKSPREIVEIWAGGVKERNGALQFITLTPELMQNAFEKFQENNWETGLSSPWIDSYKISEIQSNLNEASYNVTFKKMTSAGGAGENVVTIHLRNNNDKWRINKISSSINIYYFNLN